MYTCKKCESNEYVKAGFVGVSQVSIFQWVNCPSLAANPTKLRSWLAEGQ